MVKIIMRLIQDAKACKKSRTKLIIFPAHNEGSKLASIAQQRCEGTYLLDWREEIDELIAVGRSKWYFCINDSHLHSTALAGYVGAHMIYRAIYSEVPEGKMKDSINYKDIQSVLGDYVNTANTDNSVFYLV